MQHPEQTSQTPERAAQDYTIPVEGTLGLLALGAAGLRAWRRVRDAAQETAPRGDERPDTGSE